MDRWNSFGVRTQLRRGVQDGDCGIVNGEISVCGRNRGFATSGFIIGETASAVTQSYLDSSGHTRASVIEVCQNCGYSNSFLQHLLSHEFGHALALAHTRDCASAVQGEPNCGRPEYASSPHERDSLRFWYNHTS